MRIERLIEQIGLTIVLIAGLVLLVNLIIVLIQLIQ